MKEASERSGRDSRLMGARIVTARAEHVPWLPAIERAAAQLFSSNDVPDHLWGRTCDLEDLARAQQEGLLWVALARSPDAGDGAPVGFALVEELDGQFHLDELDVHPDFARRGIGRRLVETVLGAARRAGSPAVTLTTFRHLSWNAPFYRSCGFRELDESDLGPELRAAFESEIATGLERAKRVAMRCDLGS